MVSQFQHLRRVMNRRITFISIRKLLPIVYLFVYVFKLLSSTPYNRQTTTKKEKKKRLKLIAPRTAFFTTSFELKKKHSFSFHHHWKYQVIFSVNWKNANRRENGGNGCHSKKLPLNSYKVRSFDRAKWPSSKTGFGSRYSSESNKQVQLTGTTRKKSKNNSW